MTKITFTLTAFDGKTTLIKTNNLANAVNKMYAIGHRESSTLTKTTTEGRFSNKVITTVKLPEPGYNEAHKDYLARVTTLVAKA